MKESNLIYTNNVEVILKIYVFDLYDFKNAFDLEVNLMIMINLIHVE